MVPKPLPARSIMPKGEIGPSFVSKAMPWFETFWHEHKRYPSEVDIIQRFGFTQKELMKLHASKFWLACLDRRGIARPNLDQWELSDRQVAAIAILTNFNDVRNPVAKLSKIGVSEEELQGWRSNPAFNETLRKWTDDTLDNVAADATTELARAIKKGNFQAIKFYYEITGRAQSPEAVNVKAAMQILIEAVQKHVKDPTVLESIASEVRSSSTLRSLGA